MEKAQLEEILSQEIAQGDTLFSAEHGNDILDSHRQCPFDILFLDLELPGLSGIEVATEIRITSHKTVMIFLTKHREFGPEAYALKVFFYAMKPIRSSEVKKLLRDARSYLRRTGPEYAVRTMEGLKIIPMQDILYLESHKHQIILHTSYGGYQSVYRIKEAEQELQPHGFCRLHRSYLINLRFVTQVHDRVVMLAEDIRIPIGPTCSIKAFKAALIAYRLTLRD